MLSPLWLCIEFKENKDYLKDFIIYEQLTKHGHFDKIQ